MALNAYYTLEETDPNGNIHSSRVIPTADIKRVLRDHYDIPHDQIELSLAVTADNIGVPYDLYKADAEGRFIWSARLTLLVKYWRA